MNTNKKHYWTDQERRFISRCYIEGRVRVETVWH